MVIIENKIILTEYSLSELLKKMESPPLYSEIVETTYPIVGSTVYLYELFCEGVVVESRRYSSKVRVPHLDDKWYNEVDYYLVNSKDFPKNDIVYGIQMNIKQESKIMYELSKKGYRIFFSPYYKYLVGTEEISPFKDKLASDMAIIQSSVKK